MDCKQTTLAMSDPPCRGKTDIGMSRLSLSDDDKHVRDCLVETTRSLGCKVSIDSMVRKHDPQQLRSDPLFSHPCSQIRATFLQSEKGNASGLLRA